MLNQGAAGLKDTENILQSAGISYTGREPENLVVKESHGIKFGFLAYTYAADSTSIANMLDSLRLKNDIKEAKDKTDVVIVMMHAGTEYTSAPNRQQIDFAHQAIDSGADLVIGSHPHWIQSVEKYQGKTIIYSLGNLVFDQMWSPQTSIGLVAKTYFKGKELDRIEYIPVEIKNYGQTEIMPDGAEKSRILKFLNGS
jgi:poly-gamma-glutamate synthesis protein (capsule biosynthesis protein)